MIDAIEHGSIRELRMNRPPVNALDPGLLAAIGKQLHRAVDDGCEAIVLSGREGMFTAGLDIPVLLKLNDDEMRVVMESDYLVIYIHQWQRQTPRNLLDRIAARTPEHCIWINDLEYARVYRLDGTNAP